MIDVVCPICGKQFQTYPHIIKRVKTGPYCSEKCSYLKFTNKDDLIDRFWAKVDKKEDNECWEWIGNLQHDGYPRFKITTKVILAHRFSWELHNGDIPNKMLVCHHCDNRKCVNPNHLFLGTHQDNSTDMVLKGRHRNPTKNKIDKNIADKIRTIYNSRKYTQKELGLMFSLHQSSISLIVTNKEWR